MQPLDILFDGVNELGLILLDGSTDLSDCLVTRQMLWISVSYLWANEKGIEL